MTIGRRRDRDRLRVGLRRAGRTATAGVTGPPAHSARRTATASSSRATRSVGRGKVHAVGLVLPGAPPIPMPRTSRPPLAIWSVDAIRARSAGWRFMTLTTNEPTVTRDVLAAAIDRIVQLSTTGTADRPGP